MLTKKYLLNRIEELEKEVRDLKYSEPEFCGNEVFAQVPKMSFVIQVILDYLGLKLQHQVEKYELRKKGENP